MEEVVYSRGLELTPRGWVSGRRAFQQKEGMGLACSQNSLEATVPGAQ